MALPVLAGVGFALVDRFWVTPWTQQGTELVVVRAVDSTSGRPIGGAEVRLTGASDQALRTDPQGIAAFAVPYRFEGTTSPFGDTRREETETRIDVAAEGHEAGATSLRDHRAGRGREYGLPDAIVVPLRPRTAPAR